MIGFDFDGTLHNGDLTFIIIRKILLKKYGIFSVIIYYILKLLVKFNILKYGDDISIILNNYHINLSDIDQIQYNPKWKKLYNLYKSIEANKKMIISGCLDVIIFKFLKKTDNIICSETYSDPNSGNIYLKKFYDFQSKVEASKDLNLVIYFGDKKGDLNVKNGVIVS